jgi:hypothetical protein
VASKGVSGDWGVFKGELGLTKLNAGIAGVVDDEVMDCGEANCDGRSAALLQGVGESWLGRDGDLELTSYIGSGEVNVKYIFSYSTFPSVGFPQPRGAQVPSEKGHLRLSH